jgi:hypothetical protein
MVSGEDDDGMLEDTCFSRASRILPVSTINHLNNMANILRMGNDLRRFIVKTSRFRFVKNVL